MTDPPIPPVACPNPGTCDRGFLRHAGAEGIASCPCRVERGLRSRMLTAGVPRRLHWFRLGVEVPESCARQTEAMQRLLAGPAFEGAVLVGPVGRGKSGLAAAVCRHYLERGEHAAWLDVEESAALDRKAEFREAVETKGLVVLDDLGAEHDNEWAAFMVGYAVKRREASAYPYLLTSNLSVEEIRVRYGDRLEDRISRLPVIPFSGPSLRRLEATRPRQREGVAP